MTRLVSILSYLLIACAGLAYQLLRKKNTLASLVRDVQQEIDNEYIRRRETRVRPSLVEQWEQDALAAGLEIRAREFVTIALMAALGGFMAALILTNNLLISVPCTIVGLYAPRWYLKSQKAKRMTLFDKQLEHALILAANTLRVGHGLTTAIDAIADMPDPLGSEFQRAQREINLGLPLDEALDRIQRRVNSAEFQLTVTAIKVNKEVGGNLIEMFDRVAETIRERQAMNSAIRAATTRGRTSAAIVTGMPYVVLGVVSLIEKDYLRPFLSSALGRVIITGTVLMNGIGWLLITRMTRIELE